MVGQSKIGKIPILPLYLSLLLVGGANAYYCDLYGTGHTYYCADGCCGSSCCDLDVYDYSDSLQAWVIAVIVLSSLFGLAILIGAICCIVSCVKKSQRVVQPFPSNAVVGNPGNQGLGQQQQLGPPGYGSAPGYGPTPGYGFVPGYGQGIPGYSFQPTPTNFSSMGVNPTSATLAPANNDPLLLPAQPTVST